VIIQRKVQRIIRELALKYGTSEKEMTEIVFSCYELLKKTMTEADKNDTSSFKNVRIMYLGLFAAKKSRLKYLNNKKKEKDVI
jgi:hypothetical protein